MTVPCPKQRVRYSRSDFLALRTAPSTLATKLNPELTEEIIKVAGYPIYGAVAPPAGIAGAGGAPGLPRGLSGVQGEHLDLDRVIKGGYQINLTADTT